MKKYFLLFILGLVPWVVNADNLALRLNGIDNSVRTGIGFMEAPWTVETWIKGNDCSWKETEVIIGGGEYSSFTQSDNYPLVVKDGHLFSTRAGLRAEARLDDKWHHVALTCDGSKTSLLMDGEIVASKDTTVIIIPGAIGITDKVESVFCGDMDEVRVWKAAVSLENIRKWMGSPVDNTHPNFKNLIAYYNFDAGIDDTAINWMGSGYLSFHLRNARVTLYQTTPIAYTVENSNEKFKDYAGDQRLFNAISIESEWDSDRGDLDTQVMKLRIAVQGSKKPMQLENLVLDLSETDHLSDLSSVHVYSTGKVPRSPQRIRLFTGVPQKTIKIDILKANRPVLTGGINYFLVTADVNVKAGLGNKIRIKVKSFTLDGKKYVPSLKETLIHKQVTENSYTNPNCFRILQWNIWHGGTQVPLQGLERIIELCKYSKADIVTMEEGYGSQERIAAELGFNLQTPSPKDNLVLMSHFPLIKQRTEKKFFSNPAIVEMGKGRSILLDNIWIRYGSYTENFPDIIQDTKEWVSQDSILSMADMRYILDNDVNPVLKKEDMPSIISGDFNSCSHLDWTKEAACFHGGYGPVSFPTSRFMMERGYTDSFREVHPDEIERHEGTWAGIYQQLDFSRIDFIYYKGKIRAVSSKVIQTSPEIDDIWASDHSAVVTTFVWK